MLLDVGSGSQPHPELDVGCDLYFSAHLEGGIVAFTDNFVICDAHNLPFRTKAFSKVTCRHVMEHLKEPRICFIELKRVAHSGEIEVPRLIYEELLCGFPYHQWTFIKKKGKLYFRKPNKMKINNSTIIPLGWATHKITLHKKFSWLVMSIRRIPIFNLKYRW